MININDIYCRHWLVNNDLLSYLKKAKFDIYQEIEHKGKYCFHILDTIHYNSLLKDNYLHQ